jgi:L-aspartate oxidase
MIELAPRALWGLPVIIGGGVAGTVAALTLAPRRAILLDSTPPGEGSAASQWAQGGLAAAVGPDDSARLHIEDTIAAGAGLNDPDAVARIIGAGVATVAALEAFGVRFDRAPDGGFALGLEAAHSRRRILHVRDATGKAILDALSARAAQTPSIERVIGAALSLTVDDSRISGVVVRIGEAIMLLPTAAVILATGGVGGLWRSTTNPVGARGGGLALAGRAGAALADLEFMQFHPTALAVGADPMPLVSEAVRGEGAVLIDADGKPFMGDTPGGDLAARDVVARAVFRQWSGGGRAALDVRHWPEGKFARRFPTIFGVLAAHGIDPARDPIPVRPAAHYHMGGIRVDATGRSSIEGLWAAGEVASTGLQGANRLASNSLLEAAACGRIAAEDVGGIELPAIAQRQFDFGPAAPAPAAEITTIRAVMDRDVGVVRDEAGLTRAITRLGELRHDVRGTLAEDAAAVALLIARAAERRKDSRGAHFRADAEPPTSPPEHSVSYWAELE